MEEKDIKLSSVINVRLGEVNLRREIAYLFGNNATLAGFYFLLIHYSEIGVLNNITQAEMSNIMGMSENTFKKHRLDLEATGVISMKPYGKTKIIEFNDLQVLQRTIIPKTNLVAYFERQRQKVKAYSHQEIEQRIKEEVAQARQTTLDGLPEQNVKTPVKRKVVKKKEEQKFSAEDYDIVIRAYRKYKGVGLMGPEVLRAKHAIKQMFLARRSVKQIVDCMKFFASVKGEKKFMWLNAWTLETVMKKIPEFVAGTLQDDSEDEEKLRWL